MKTQEHKNIKTNYKELLRKKMHDYVNFVYRVTRQFPKEELYSSVTQWRRATLSIILNYIEGYARKRPASQLHFFEISYGSFKESKYLLFFSKEQEFISKDEYELGLKLAEEIGAMLWTEIASLEKSINPK